MPTLEKLELSNFRNINKLQLDFGKGVNIFLGKNGQGKTNIIESIYLLTKGHSFRPGKNDTFIKKGDNNSKVIGFIKGRGREDEVSLSLLGNKKIFEINKKRISSIKLAKSYSNVLFSPESLSAIKNGPEERRSLVDDFLVSHLAVNASTILDYRKCVRSRNRVLKNFKQGFSSKEECQRLLESLNPSLLSLGLRLTWSRINSLKDISQFLVKSFKQITKSANVDISVDYLISSKSALSMEKEEIYDAMQKRLSELENSELATGVTLVGPHKHDMQFLYQGEDSRYFCSQGEQRALILSFKMAQVMYYYRAYGEYPILLLDDVLSELDEFRRKNLIEFLSEIKSQIFITATEISSSLMFGNHIKTFRVEPGGVITSGSQQSQKEYSEV